MMFDIECHRNELARTLKVVYNDIKASSLARGRKKYPPRYSSFLWHTFKILPIPREVAFNDNSSQALRKIHDFYGWKAKDTAKEKGHCSGALYRTAGFMALAGDERVGTKDRESRTIHIEHSVPIKVLMNWLRHNVHQFETPGDLHNFLIHYSVITAFSHEEEKGMKGTVHASGHPGFHKTGEINGEHPFLRYKPLVDKSEEFHIYNVVTGKEINVEAFTYEDHKRALIDASELCGISSSGLGVYDGSLFNNASWFLNEG